MNDLNQRKNKGPIPGSKKWCFFAIISRDDCLINVLFEKSTFPHHISDLRKSRIGFKGKLRDDKKYASKIQAMLVARMAVGSA